MYSDLKSVQYVISMLKKYGVSDVVMSPGGCDIPLIKSVEYDSFFTGYSVVDERSAVYFAIGVAQAKKKVVALICTSGTAVSNYLPGVTEAFYQGVPLVVITADRHPYLYRQMETQKVDQIGIFKEVTKKAVSLPVIRDENDLWYCQRLVNEAFLELNHRGKGPVHINIPTAMLGINTACTTETLPPCKKIDRLESAKRSEEWVQKVAELQGYQRILVICGQHGPFDVSFETDVVAFFERCNCVVSVEHLSNLKCRGCLLTYPVTELLGLKALEQFMPDLVISFGHNLAGVNIKNFLRENREHFTHWLVEETGDIKDVFMALDTIFECSPEYFFRRFAEALSAAGGQNDMEYFDLWQKAKSGIVFPEIPFSNMYVARKLAQNVPSGALVHLGILNSTRLVHLFEMGKDIEVYSNIGALGIDGSMSSFVGQSVGSDRLCFLLIGDLSFFYDMNSILIRHRRNNVRIIMMNNGGGGEFHLCAGDYDRVDEHISAAHSYSAKGWVESLGFQYHAVSTTTEMDEVMRTLTTQSERPIFVEVCVDMSRDTELFKTLGRLNQGGGDSARTLLRNVVTASIGEGAAKGLMNTARKIFGKD